MGLFSWLGFDSDCEKEPVALSDKNFHQEVLRSDVPVLVDVWSMGCQPCLQLVPTIRRLACKYEGRVKVAQLDAGKAPRTVHNLGIRGTPTLLFFKNGKLIERTVGFKGQLYLEEVIEEELLETPASEVN
jgi:thioredoxin 1